jgi:hypothetical protein
MATLINGSHLKITNVLERLEREKLLTFVIGKNYTDINVITNQCSSLLLALIANFLSMLTHTCISKVIYIVRGFVGSSNGYSFVVAVKKKTEPACLDVKSA